MRNTKWMRFLLIALSVVMVLSLFACGGNGGEEETTVNNTTEDTTVEDTTVEDTTVEDTTVEDTTVEDTTVEDTTVEDTTVEDTTEEETTVPEPKFEGNWHVSVDAFLADVDGNIGNALAGDFGEVDVVIAGASTNKTNGITILDGAGTSYASVDAGYVFFGAGWIAFDGYDVENFVCNVYAADGTLLKTVELGLNDAEEGVVTHVSQSMGFSASTVAHRMTVDVQNEMIDLTEYAEQTVTVVYSVDVIGTEFTVDMIKLDVNVPEAPEAPVEPEETTVEGYISGEAIYNAGVHSTYTATLNDDGTVTVTSNQAKADQAMNLTAFATITAKYMVVKYKTNGGSAPYVYATTTSGSIGGYTNGTIVDDNEWQYMAVDLTKCTGYVLGEAVTFLRLDVCEGDAGESMTIEYVQLTDDISAIENLLPKNYVKNIDHIYVDGNESADHRADTAVTGSSVYFSCWTAVDGCTATAARYVVTDANGEKTTVEIPLLTKDDTADPRFYTRQDITDHVIQNCSFSTDTLGYVFNVTADLSAFAGQTVTVRLVIETADGTSVSFHKLAVTVPAAQ